MQLPYASSSSRIIYKNRRIEKKATKISNYVPEEKHVQKLDLKSMENFIGIYEFEPFEISITIEEGKLYAQPNGSNRLALSAITSNSFLVEEIGAEITFVVHPNDVMEATLLLEGNTVIGYRRKE